MTLTLVPAYGRDYQNPEQVQKDWDNQKDFLIADISSPWDGSYVNKQQLSSGDKVKIRYKKRTKIAVLTV